MASNISNNEKTLKTMFQVMDSDNWSIDRFILYSNYNGNVMITGNILDNYRDYFEQFLITVDLDRKFYYQPMAFSNYYYGTPDLDFLVLYFASIPTLFEFNKEKIKILPKTKLEDIIRLANFYKENVEESRVNPTKYLPSSTTEI